MLTKKVVNITVTEYRIRGELEIEDEGHIVYLQGEYGSERNVKGNLFLWATTESLYSIEEEHSDIYGDLASRCNQLSDKGVEKFFPGTDQSERYADMAAHMLEMFRKRVQQDNRDDDITEECVRWDWLYNNEDRKEPLSAIFFVGK